MKKVAAYVRVSTVGQNEAGQVEAIRAYCKNHTIEPVWFIDRASGSNLNRPEFEKMQASIFAGEISTIVVFKIDRLSRDLRDGLNLIQGWLEADVRLISITQQFDLCGAIGKLISSILFAVAEMEQELRRERQAAGIEVAKQKGLYKGRAPGSRKFSAKRCGTLRTKGLTHREIAEALGCSVRTVVRLLFEVNQ